MSGLVSLVNAVQRGVGLYKEYKSIKYSFEDVFDPFNSSSVSEMFDKSGLSTEQIKTRLIQDSENMERLKHAGVFQFEIQRVEPYYDKDKSKIISSMVKQVDIITDGMEVEEKKIGSGYLNTHVGMQSGEISVTFFEFEEGDVLDFLTKISDQNTLTGLAEDLGVGSSFNALGQKIEDVKELTRDVNRGLGLVNGLVGSSLQLPQSISGFLGGAGDFVSMFTDNNHGNILPTDGTFLLPYEYYFSIKMSHLIRDRKTNMSYEKIIVQDDYILDGNVSVSYATDNEGYLEATANFKPIKSFR